MGSPFGSCSEALIQAVSQGKSMADCSHAQRAFEASLRFRGQAIGGGMQRFGQTQLRSGEVSALDGRHCLGNFSIHLLPEKLAANLGPRWIVWAIQQSGLAW